MRWIEWTWDPDPGDDWYEAVFAFLLREPGGAVQVDSDRHRFGVFSRASWLTWMAEAGLPATSRLDPWRRDVFAGRKRRM